MKVAAYSGTRNLYSGMKAAYKSLLMHSDVDLIYLLIEDDAFPDELPDCVRAINVSNQKAHWSSTPNAASGFTYMALVRSTYAFMFPWLSKLLSLDVDTIAEQDVSDLWDINLNGYYFSAAPEFAKSHGGMTYTNIGVCMYNLDALRDGKAEEVVRKLGAYRYQYLEQDAFNYCCQGKILPMDSAYNATLFTEKVKEPKITHYAGYSDWQQFDLVRKYRNIPLDEVMKAHEECVKKHRI